VEFSLKNGTTYLVRSIIFYTLVKYFYLQAIKNNQPCLRTFTRVFPSLFKNHNSMESMMTERDKILKSIYDAVDEMNEKFVKVINSPMSR